MLTTLLLDRVSSLVEPYQESPFDFARISRGQAYLAKENID